ncbi:MAG: hypothetical protein NC340_04450 [Ruminococcus flavefaciens]|nr:hypothetical protein [Ruminococcus flavefaciens]MCM1229085.1 hypothetical protein [Ruminococcus flavefaciens]
MIHAILEIIMLFVVCILLTLPPLLAYILKATEEDIPIMIFHILSLGVTVLNALLIIFLDIGIGWKILFFILILLLRKLPLTLTFPYLMNCMFPGAVETALDNHFLPTLWLSNKVYMMSELTRPDIGSKIVLFIFCILILLAFINVNIDMD